MLVWLIRFWKEMKGNTGESDSTGGKWERYLIVVDILNI